MKIVYDNIIFASQKCGGVSTVWYELEKRALRDGLDLSFVEFAPVDNVLGNSLAISPDQIRTVPAIMRKVLKYAPVFYPCREPFIFHSSYYRVCSNPRAINVTTVHDFTNEKFQTGQAALKERFIKHRAIKHSDYIICISENTGRDFFEYFPGFPQDRVKVVYNGVSDDFHPLTERPVLPQADMALEREYVLFVGARGGYKHFDLVVDAMLKTNFDLVLTGSQLDEQERRMLIGLEGRIHYAGRVDTVTLNALYNGAFALVYPSEYEGFGLPVLEAQRAGCPVIAYNGSSIPEIIGKTPLLMNALSADGIVAKLELLRDVTLREKVVKEGLANAALFSWEKMYGEVRKLYSDALTFGKRQSSLRG